MRAHHLLLPSALLLALGCANPKVAPVPIGSHLLVSQPAQDSVQLVTPTSGTVLDRFQTGVGPRAVAIAFNQRAALVANTGGNASTLTTIDLVERIARQTIDLSPHSGPSALQFTSNNTALVAAEATDALLEVVISTARVKRTLECGGKGPRALLVHPKGEHIFVANADGTLAVVGMESGAVERTGRLPGAPTCMTIRPDGSELWFTLEGGTLAVVDTKDLKVAAAQSHPGAAAARYTRDSKHVLVSCTDGTLTAYDAKSRQATARVELPPGTGPAGPIQLDRRGHYAFVSLPDAGEVAVVALHDMTLHGTLATGGSPGPMEFFHLDPRSRLPYGNQDTAAFPY